MNIKSRWLFFCAGEPEFASQEDWGRFVQMIYAEWRQEQLARNPETVCGHSPTDPKISTYSFEEFSTHSEIYKELESVRPREFD